jgi:FHA domain
MPTLLVHLPDGIHAWRVDGDVIMGRDRSCSVRVDQSGVSHQHAMLKLETIAGEPHWCLDDLKSKNGTRQNRKRITSSVVLNDTDRFALGKWQVDFHLADLTCVACHSALDAGELVHTCNDCGAKSHSTCRAELDACAVLGCGQDKQAESSDAVADEITSLSPNARAYLAEDVTDVIDERPAWAGLFLSTLVGLFTFGVPVAVTALVVSRGLTRLRVEHPTRFEVVSMLMVMTCAVVSALWWLGDLQTWIRG